MLKYTNCCRLAPDRRDAAAAQPQKHTTCVHAKGWSALALALRSCDAMGRELEGVVRDAGWVGFGGT